MTEFDKWFKNRHTKSGLYEEALCGKDDATYIRHEMRKAYLAGQQSQQAKIDELQKQVITQGQRFNDQAQKLKDAEYFNQKLQGQIDEALTYLRHTDFRECKESILFDILKGNKDEN